MVPVRHGLAYLSDLVRWREWYASKLPWYLVGMSYALLRRESPAAAHIPDMAFLIALFCLYASFGHIVNDYGDLEADRVTGKRRVLASWSKPAAWAALTASAATALVVAASFDRATVALMGLAVLLAAMYSLPPARLKERGVLGWVAAALTQRTLPLAIVFQALGAWDATAVALCGLGTLIGLRFIIVHQILDRQNDLHAGLRTTATTRGDAWLTRLVTRGLLPVEAATACLVVVAMAASLPAVAVLPAGYAGWLWIRGRRGHPWSPVSYAPLDVFYSLLWPLLLTALLAMRDPLYLAVLALALALQHRRLMAYVRMRPLSAARRAMAPR